MDEPRLTTIARAFEIISVLIEAEYASPAELSVKLGIPESTLHDYLSTLLNLGYLVRQNGKYKVSIRFLEIGEKARTNRPLYRLAKPGLERLAVETEENVYLLIEENGDGRLLDMVKSERGVDLGLFPGFRLPLENTAAGKAILANTEPDRREQLLAQVNERNEDIDIDELRDELELVRDRGIAFNRGSDYAKGVRAVAVPVFKNDELVGSIAVAGPKNRMQGDYFDTELPELLQEITNVIEINLLTPVG